jgi:hypothetical protein
VQRFQAAAMKEIAQDRDPPKMIDHVAHLF